MKGIDGSLSDIVSRAPNDAYRENYDRIFGKKTEPEPSPASTGTFGVADIAYALAKKAPRGADITVITGEAIEAAAKQHGVPERAIVEALRLAGWRPDPRADAYVRDGP